MWHRKMCPWFAESCSSGARRPRTRRGGCPRRRPVSAGRVSACPDSIMFFIQPWGSRGNVCNRSFGTTLCSSAARQRSVREPRRAGRRFRVGTGSRDRKAAFAGPGRGSHTRRRPHLSAANGTNSAIDAKGRDCPSPRSRGHPDRVPTSPPRVRLCAGAGNFFAHLLGIF